MATFDQVLEEAGTFGRCQKRIFALLCMLTFPFSCSYVGIVFQGFTPEHWCRDPVLAQRSRACGWSPEEELRLARPRLHGTASCSRYRLDWNSSGLGCIPEELDLGGAALETCKDGWEYQYDRKTFVTEFDLVCADSWWVDAYQAAINVGFLVGSFAFGFFADRFGRKTSFMASNLLNGVVGLALALAPDFIAILGLRTLFGFGAKGSWMSAFVLITEIVGVEHRRTVGILFQMFFGVANLFLIPLAYLIRDWRWLQVAITIPYILIMSYYWLIPESPRWLISQNNLTKALQITKAIAKENKRTLSSTFETPITEEGNSPAASLLDLIRTPNMRKHTIILMFNWFTGSVVYQGLVMRVGLIGGNIYIGFLVAGLVEIPASLFILLTIERIGRRLPFAGANIVAGATCFITALIPDSMFWLKTVVACVSRLGITISFAMVTFVNVELYPTYMRNMGVSVCSTLCDIGGIAVPFLLYRLAAVWLELPLIIFGFIAVFAGGSVLMLPETKGVPLPETIDDVEFPDRERQPPPEAQSLHQHSASDLRSTEASVCECESVSSAKG